MRQAMKISAAVAALVSGTCHGSLVLAQEDADELAKKLSNPIANLVSVPLQFNADFSAGPDDKAELYTLNIQPVIPIHITEDWNVISRTILPVVGREDLFPLDDDIWGLGDTLQSLFLSPTALGPGGLIWGVGPVFQLPTANDDLLGSEKWGAGPTAVALIQQGPWTAGALVNHVWSFAGEEDRLDISRTFLQPFVTFALGNGQTLSLNSESTFDWHEEQWTVPVNLGYTKVFRIGGQPISFQLGGRYYPEVPEGGPDWGIRSTITFLFPSK
jgi:hypothetical protein